MRPIAGILALGLASLGLAVQTETDIKPWLRPPPRSYLFTNANIVDVQDGKILGNSSLVTNDGKVQSIFPTSSQPDNLPGNLTTVDCQGRYLHPGLFDAHVHLVAVSGFTEQSMAFGSPNEVQLLREPYYAAQMLHRGFTSIRDCGGAQLAIKEAIDDGIVSGPRMFISGHALSQSGGHGDLRSSHTGSSECCGGPNHLGRLCNGRGDCSKATREELRRGADFIKIMGSGGVASPTDQLSDLQFTADELKAIVEVADNVGKFVTAHVYTPKAIRHLIDNGVRGIEHANYLDEPTAKLMADKGIWLTPTLVTHHELSSDRWEGYVKSDSKAKNSGVLDLGLNALKLASDHGIAMCYGSDLLGPMAQAQTYEFTLRAKVLSPVEILQSATVNPAKMMGWEDSIGQLKEGFLADILVLDKNPLDDVTVFDQYEKYVLGVMKEGRVYKSRWDALPEDAQIPVRA